MRVVLRINFKKSTLSSINAEFVDRTKSYQKTFKLHEKTKHIKQQQRNQWISSQNKKQLSDRIVRESKDDFDIKSYISKFNTEHKGKINLLDFSNYTTQFSDFKKNPISKEDMQILRQFQKRKIDQRFHRLQKQNQQNIISEDMNRHILDDAPSCYQDQQITMSAQVKPQVKISDRQYKQINFNVQINKGMFKVNDDFVMLLLDRNTSTKVTTLNRINFYRTLVFMGNGNGLISYGKSRDLSPNESLNKAIIDCKKNIIAIPLDPVCTMPRPINSRFQDFHSYINPNPSFNAYGHPLFSHMLALSGISHARFKTVHSDKNKYTMLHSFFKAVTQNTTPKQMAQMEGFKVYRQRFIRPLTQKQTHNRSY